MEENSEPLSRAELESRDESVARILGLFFGVLSLPVLAGVAFADLAIDRWINLGAGLALALVAGGFLWRGRVRRGAAGR